MDPTMKKVLRNTLDDLTEGDFKRFKHDLRDHGRIPWGKLEKADPDDTVDLMVQVYCMGVEEVMLSILKDMNHNQLIMNLERDLGRCLAKGGDRVKVDLTAHCSGKVDVPALSGGIPMPEQEGVGGQQCSPGLVRGGDGVKVDVTAHSGGMVDAPALSRGQPMLQQGGEDMAAEEVKKKKASLKLKLQKHLKKRFSVVHQESGDYKVQDIYTELHIVEGRTGGVSNEHEVSTIDMRQIGTRPSSEDKQVKLANMFTDSATNVLTLGIAGVGKTIAVQKFVMDWVEDKANQDIDFVFVLPFRELNLKKGKHCNLLDVLESFYPYRKDLEYILDLSECKILFVLDGLDESRLKLDFTKCFYTLEAKSSVDMLISSLIKGQIVPSALLWVTTRPAAASLIPGDYFNLVTEVRGFNDLQKDEFFRKNIENPKKAERLIDHINKNRSLHIMCHLPVFCHILANLVDKILEDQSKEESAKTLTELYTLYSVSQIKRMDDKYSEDKKMSAEEKGQILVKLGKLAFKHLDKGTLIFYEKDLKKCDIDVNCGTLQAGVCTQIFNVESATTGETIFSFVHLSVQEFLAALYVLNENATHWGNCLSQTWREKTRWLFSHSRFDLYKMAVDKALQSQNGHLDLFVRFLLGLAPMLEPEIRSPLNVVLPQLAVRGVSIEKTVQYIKEKIREDISPERIINLFHCLNELGDNSLVEEINRYIKSGDEEKNLTPAQCSAFAYLLLMSAKDMNEFDLKKYLRSEEGLQRMLPVVKVSRKVWLNQCRLSKSSCKKLASVLQGTPSLLRELDMSDNYLQDEGMELLCVGLRDPQCKLEAVRLSGCLITHKGCSFLASALKSNPFYLKQLDLSYNHPGDSGVKELTDRLSDPNCKLETFRLAACKLTEESCKAVASAVKSWVSLTELDLTNNDLMDSGIQLLSAGLSSPHCKLQILRLAGCKLTEKSSKAVASALQSSVSLTELDLTDSELEDSGVQLLSAGLSSPHCKLQTLRLSGCLITHKGCSFLASALKSNPSYLKQLDLSYNHPGDSGVRELTDRLNDLNCKLRTFKFDHGGEFRIKPGPRKYACELTLDPNTACRYLSLSEGNRKVTLETHVSEEQHHPDHPERFDSWPQVLCREGQSGRCYWEAVWSGSGADVAVAYKSIQRKGASADCGFGCNDKSWSLECSGNSYSARHNTKRTDIRAPSSRSRRVGVYLDWPAGTLSFYSVSSDTLTHLHTFHSTFTEPLYPGFYVWSDSSVSLCQIT